MARSRVGESPCCHFNSMATLALDCGVSGKDADGRGDRLEQPASNHKLTKQPVGLFGPYTAPKRPDYLVVVVRRNIRQLPHPQNTWNSCLMNFGLTGLPNVGKAESGTRQQLPQSRVFGCFGRFLGIKMERFPSPRRSYLQVGQCNYRSSFLLCSAGGSFRAQSRK